MFKDLISAPDLLHNVLKVFPKLRNRMSEANVQSVRVASNSIRVDLVDFFVSRRPRALMKKNSDKQNEKT